jgi:Protein of unknown function (DUF3379)
MMEHTQYRSAILADPHSTDAELRAHREACAECREFTERLLRFESRLERALRVDILPTAAVLPFARKAGHDARAPRRWMAVAASVLLGVAIAGGVWLTLPQRSLAAAVVAHMAGEPEAWQRTEAVADAELNNVLKDSKLRLKPDAGIVSYASICSFRGHRVPHLVVQTPSGPVTVMVLVHESVRKPMQFDDEGYRGTIVPVPGHGSIAVLMRDLKVGSGEIERIAARVDDSIVWTR